MAPPPPPPRAISMLQISPILLLVEVYLRSIKLDFVHQHEARLSYVLCLTFFPA